MCVCPCVRVYIDKLKINVLSSLLCMYVYSGNFNGRLPYRSGTPCSECSEGLDYCVENLCSCEFNHTYMHYTIEYSGSTLINDFNYSNPVPSVRVELSREYSYV